MLLVILATVGWALAGVFLRWVEEKDSWQINGLRGLSFAFWMLVVCLIRYRGRLLAVIRQIPLGAAIACPSFFALGSSLYLWALSLTSVAAASSLGATAPLFAAGLAYLVIGERSPPIVLAAAIVAIGGVVWIAFDGAQGQSEMPLTFVGLAASMGYALLFAAQTVALRKYSALDVTPTFILGGLMAGGGIFGIAGMVEFSWHDLGLVFLMGLVQLALPIVLYARGARYLSTVTLMLVALLDTVLNPFFAWVGVGEVPGWNVVIGSAVIVGAVAAAIIARTRARPV